LTLNALERAQSQTYNKRKVEKRGSYKKYIKNKEDAQNLASLVVVFLIFFLKTHIEVDQLSLKIG